MNKFIPVLITFPFLFGSLGMSWGASCKKGLPLHELGNPLASMLEWQPLADQGNADAQTKIGIMYDYGGLRDYKAAMKWYKLAAKQGNKDAQNNLGTLYEDGKGVPQNYEAAVDWYHAAANGGCADAQFNLGRMYFNGSGISKNRDFARYLWRLAAENDHPGGKKMANISVPCWKFWAFYGWWKFW